MLILELLILTLDTGQVPEAITPKLIHKLNNYDHCPIIKGSRYGCVVFQKLLYTYCRPIPTVENVAYIL